MRVLFLVRHYAYLRNFDSVILELARRGHQVHVSADRWELLGGERLVERLAEESGGQVTYDWTPAPQSPAWREMGRRIRLGLDYLRFLEPRYDDAPHLRVRARERAPHMLLRAFRLPMFQGPEGIARLESLMRFFEHGLPRSERLERFLHDQRPDVVIITPLIELGAPQLDHLIAAKAAGLRTVLAVGSWDHLSSKSRLRELPDLITVWNPIQREEAIDFHGVPPERIQVTGAQCFDQWFDRQPARGREAFLDRVGLPRHKPFLLYVCSSLFRGTGSEVRFVEQWIQAIRSSPDPVLRDVNILVRPHPQRMEEWAGAHLSNFKDVVLYGSHPIDDESKNDYFDSMFHSEATVGLNTSAFIEAGCAGKPVYTVLQPELSGRNQEGTLHFRYLLEVNGGLLHVAHSFSEHLTQLRRALAGEGSDKSRRFVEGFVRPFGLAEPGTPRFVDAIETLLSHSAPAPSALPPGQALVARAALYPWFIVVAAQVWTELTRKSTRTFVQRIKRRTIERAWAPLRLRLLRALNVEPPGTRPGMVLPKVGKGADPAKLRFINVPEAQEVRELVTALGRADETIIAGPWLTETGFELLYWIPFLAWARAYGNIAPDRLFVVSRGGTASWYRHLSRHYEDVFTFYAPEEFRRRNEEQLRAHGGRLKHLEVSPFDREIVERVADRHALGKVKLLHPSAMYGLFNAYWRQVAPVTLVDAFTGFSGLRPPSRPDISARLPARYVAAKFYTNGALPDTPDSRAFVARTLVELTRTHDVVLLNTRVQFDDHGEFAPAVRDRLYSIDHLMRAEDNLEVQSAVIGGAEAFVGTYGGFSYLAPLFGVNTVAFYSHPMGFRFDHLDVARRVFSSLQLGAFVPLDLREINVVRLGIGEGIESLGILAGHR